MSVWPSSQEINIHTLQFHNISVRSNRFNSSTSPSRAVPFLVEDVLLYHTHDWLVRLQHTAKRKKRNGLNRPIELKKSISKRRIFDCFGPFPMYCVDPASVSRRTELNVKSILTFSSFMIRRIRSPLHHD